VKRREFITLLGGAAAWPLTARAQEPKPVIGYLSARSHDDTAHLVDAFRRGLAENGYVEGRNVLIEYRWAMGQHRRLPQLAEELVNKQVAVVVSTGGETAALAAKAATSTIPIVFAVGRDPVKLGLAASYNRPGGNATGINILTQALEPKRLGLLQQLVPRATTFGVLLDPNFSAFENQLRGAEEAGRALAVPVQILRAATDSEIDGAFATILHQRIAALAVAPGAFFDTRRDKLVRLAARHGVPTMYHFREFVAAGGLISYGVDSSNTYRQVGVYAGHILRGATPAELPVLQPTKYELAINLRTAKALGLTIPPTLLALADEVIE
jgi:putative ABC transport system substrate-binding protein